MSKSSSNNLTNSVRVVLPAWLVLTDEWVLRSGRSSICLYYCFSTFEQMLRYRNNTSSYPPSGVLTKTGREEKQCFYEKRNR